MKGIALVTMTAPVIGTRLLEVEIRGAPVPQGQIRSLGKGRPSVHGNAEKLLPWRDHVQFAIEASMAVPSVNSWPYTGPVEVLAAFTMKKPTSAPKRRKTWPITRPDLDKLARAALDALTNAGAVRDDSQVVTLLARKLYPNEHPDALPAPGLRLVLRSIETLELTP